MRKSAINYTAISLLMAPLAAQAAILDVPSTYPSIQAAVNAAAPGDTIQIAAGSYNEDVLVNKSLHLAGAGAASTTVVGTRGDGTTNTVNVTAHNVEISGLTITRDGNTAADWNNANGVLNNEGVMVGNLTGFKLRDCRLTGNRNAVLLYGTPGATIRNNVITDNRTGLHFVNQTANTVVEENEITNNWAMGILFREELTPSGAPGSIFRHNNLSGNWYGQVVDYHSGAPGSKPKDFSLNWLGTVSPAATTSASGEPGYAVQIPVAFGGSATPPGGKPEIAGSSSANILYTPFLLSGVDTNVESTPGRGTYGFQADIASLGPVSILEVPGSGYSTIQAAINAAAPGQTIILTPGTFTESSVNVNKAVTIKGPNAGTAGSAARVAEAVITNTAITVTASGAVIDGVEIFQTNDNADAVLIQAAASFRNSVVRRNGVNAGIAARGVTTANVTGVNITGNLFTGDTSGGLFGTHKTWNSAVFTNGGAVTITGNTFQNVRTALNLDDFNAAFSVTGNSFQTCGTYISFGGVAPVNGNHTISGNDFGFNFAIPPVSNATVFNNSNVAATFRLDATGNTFGGIATAALTDTQKFLMESRMFHRGRSSRQGVVDYVAGQQIVMPGTTIASAIDAASAGNSVLVGPGTFNEDVTVNKAVTLKGAGAGTTTISGPIGGGSSTVTITASNAVVEGFTITRAGNNTTDWNNPTLNTAGVAIQGQTLTGSIIRNNAITGMRTGIDVNHSNGHSILNNVIDNNRTGLIFRNQTDNLTVTENAITNNWTVGVLFLDASSGSNVPVQTAAGSTFANNNISGNWYGQVVDRQTGGSLPAPGSNPKNFDGNWFGTATPSRSTAASAEPGYAAQIPTAFGGTATPPLTPQPEILGSASANITAATALSSGTDTNVETSLGRGIYGFQGDASSLAPVSYADITITGTETYANLSIANGIVRVTATGTLNVTGSLHLGPGATLIVEGGTLNLGDGSTISGSFTIFNSFGSWNINGDTTINVSQSLALVTEIHVAPGVTLTVDGGGELIIDGSSIDSQTPGSPYNIVAAADGLLTIARSVVSDASITINTTVSAPQRSQIYDSRLEDTSVTVSAGAVDARVFHNIFDNVATNEGTVPAPYAAVDGWANVTSEAALQNRFTLNYQAPVLPTRTLDAAGNLYVQPADEVVVKMDVSQLGANTIVAAEALLGYNSDFLDLVNTAPAVTAEPAWEVIFDDNSISGTLGSVDSALGLDLIGPGDDGISGPATIAKIHFEALTAGRTANFFRVQTNGIYIPFSNNLLQDTRLTASSGGVPSYLAAFTANSGDLIIDDEIPVVNAASLTAVQVQPSLGSVNILTPPTTNRVYRNGAPLSLSFTASDAGLAGLETGASDAGEVLNAAEVYNDVVLTASNGVTTLSYSTITAATAAGTVTYNASMSVPPTATTGIYTITATVRDRSGNLSAVTPLGQFTIANEVLATVELESFAAATRTVTFVATNNLGASLGSWSKSITNFSGGIGSVILENVPAGTTHISAKTAWHLRSRVAVPFSPEGVGAAVLTGSDKLPGGDLNGDNVVNTFDYSILRFNWTTANAVADITGDGSVFTADYTPLRANFFTIGDGQ